MYFPPFQWNGLPNMRHPSQHPISILVPMLSYSHRFGSPISPIMTWSLRPHTSLPYNSDHFLMGSLFCVSLHKHVLKYPHEHLCLLLRCLFLILSICPCSQFLLKMPINQCFCFSWTIHRINFHIWHVHLLIIILMYWPWALKNPAYPGYHSHNEWMFLVGGFPRDMYFMD